MIVYTIQRLLRTIPVMMIVTLITFLLIHLTPTDPAIIMLGPDATQEQLANLREALDLNKPLYTQYFLWISNVLRGDLGTSIFLNEPVLSTYFSHLLPTISLTGFAILLSILIGIPLGIMAAKHKGSIRDRFFIGSGIFGVSIPNFVIALTFIMVFAVYFNVLPSGGYVPVSSGFWDYFKHLLLPGITLSFIPTSLIARITRSSFIEVFNANFVKTALSKGLRERIVVYKHVLRNASIPIVTMLGQIVPSLLGGSAVVEFAFNIHGVGLLFIDSVINRDYPLVQGAVILLALKYVLINLMIDLLYGLIDPRVRLK